MCKYELLTFRQISYDRQTGKQTYRKAGTTEIIHHAASRVINWYKMGYTLAWVDRWNRTAVTMWHVLYSVLFEKDAYRAHVLSSVAPHGSSLVHSVRVPFESHLHRYPIPVRMRGCCPPSFLSVVSPWIQTQGLALDRNQWLRRLTLAMSSNEWMDGWMDGRQMNEQTKERKNEWMNEWLENVAIANALQLEGARDMPVLFRFNYDAMPSLK